jgi:hypothetical protein
MAHERPPNHERHRSMESIDDVSLANLDPPAAVNTRPPRRRPLDTWQAQKSPHWAGKGRSNFEYVHYLAIGVLGIGRLRQGMCRVRLQTAACDVGMWLASTA